MVYSESLISFISFSFYLGINVRNRLPRLNAVFVEMTLLLELLMVLLRSMLKTSPTCTLIDITGMLYNPRSVFNEVVGTRKVGVWLCIMWENVLSCSPANSRPLYFSIKYCIHVYKGRYLSSSGTRFLGWGSIRFRIERICQRKFPSLWG